MQHECVTVGAVGMLLSVPKFDPDNLFATSWSLQEAVRRTADQQSMAVLHRELLDAAAAGLNHEPVEWWHWTDPVPPPPAGSLRPPTPIEMEDGRNFLIMHGFIEGRFRSKLDSGELLYCGRPGSFLAAYSRGPLLAGVRVLCWWRSMVQLEDGTILYGVRVEKIENRAAVARPASPTRSPANIERWYREYVQSGGKISEHVELRAAAEYFGQGIHRPTFREIRERVLKELRPELFDERGQLRTGPRPE